jgi:hypothetical protein
MRHVVIHVAEFDWVGLIGALVAALLAVFTYVAATQAKRAAQAQNRPIIRIFDGGDSETEGYHYEVGIENIAGDNAPALDIEILEPKDHDFGDQHFPEKYLGSKQKQNFSIKNPNGRDKDFDERIIVSYADVHGNKYKAVADFMFRSGDIGIKHISA